MSGSRPVCLSLHCPQLLNQPLDPQVSSTKRRSPQSPRSAFCSRLTGAIAALLRLRLRGRVPAPHRFGWGERSITGALAGVRLGSPIVSGSWSFGVPRNVTVLSHLDFVPSWPAPRGIPRGLSSKRIATVALTTRPPATSFPTHQFFAASPALRWPTHRKEQRKWPIREKSLALTSEPQTPSWR